LLIYTDKQNLMKTGSLEIPKNMHLKEGENSILFEYSWFKLKYVVSMISAPVFAFFLIKSDYIAGDFSHFTIPVIILILISFYVMYHSLAKLVNTTQIRVSHQELKVQHGPIPFFKGLALKKENVSQLYVTQHRIGHRYYVYSSTYQINAILADDEVVTLVRGLHYPQQGRFIENKIEEFLGITDIHVEGELAKD